MIRASTLLVVLLVLACKRVPRPASEQAADRLHLKESESGSQTTVASDSSTAPPARDSALAAYLAARGQFGANEQAIRAAVGAPDSMEAMAFQNMHDSTQTDTVIRLYYPGALFVLYRVTLTHEDMLGQVILTRSRGSRPLGIGVGSTRDELQAVLGPPTEASQDDSVLAALDYERPYSLARIRFVLEGNRVSRVEWLLEID